MNSKQTLLHRIDQYLNTAPRPACDIEQAGPFTLFFRRDSLIPELSYARPTAPLSDDLREAISEVRAAFARRNRVCRWEFIADLADGLAVQLVQQGFPEPLPRPLMVVTRETFQPELNLNLAVRRISEGEARAVDRVLQKVFGGEEAETAPSDEGNFLEGLMNRGASVYAAFVEGQPVAGGVHSPVGATTEVAGIGTLQAYRRRGIAGALTSALVADAFERGCECVFLSAADETVQRVYARVGFARIGMAMDTTDVERANEDNSPQ